MGLESESESLSQEVTDIGTMIIFQLSDKLLDQWFEAKEYDTTIQRI
jgi:hypothetical protein